MTEKAAGHKQKPFGSVIPQTNKMSKFMNLTQTAGKKEKKGNRKNKICESLKTEHKMQEQIQPENRENSA